MSFGNIKFQLVKRMVPLCFCVRHVLGANFASAISCIGGVVVAKSASELIYPIAVAIENRLTVDELARTFTVYPSLSGTIMEVARALHTPNV